MTMEMAMESWIISHQQSIGSPAKVHGLSSIVSCRNEALGGDRRYCQPAMENHHKS